MECEDTAMRKQNPLSQRLITFVGTRKFFWGIIALLVLQAAWITSSGRYPMAFDEDFHFNIIRYYAHHLSPFWNSQPIGSETFGAITRDPSYLYHYVLSFPYRLVNLFTHSQTVQVLWLRALNIGLFAGGLIIYRRLLLKTGASRALVQGCLLLFVLIPVVPLLAAQINYDNLFIPLVGLSMLLAVQFDAGLAKRRLNVRLLVELLIVCLLTSLVKYAFLPVFLAIIVFLVVRYAQIFRHGDALKKPRKIGKVSGLLLVVLLALAGGLFVERYGVNTVRYHTPVPDCAQVLSVRQCSAYAPWIRDYTLETSKVNHVSPDPVAYMRHWLYGMWLRLFFAVDGPASNFQTKGPLLIPGLGAVIFAGVGAVLVLRYNRRIFRTYNTSALVLMMAVTLTYTAALWVDGFRAYLRTGQPVAINGRYLLPVLLPVFLVTALAFKELLRRRPQLALTIACAAVVSLAWGGGALTYILRCEPSWLWPNSSVRQANHEVQQLIGPVTPGYHNAVQFLH